MHRLAKLVARRLSTVRADLSLAIIEAFLIVVAYCAALSVDAFDSNDVVQAFRWQNLLIALPVIVAVHLSANVVFGNYGHVWEHASIDEAVRVVAASMSSGFVLLAGFGLYQRGEVRNYVPMGVIVIGALLTMGGMGALRFWSRLFAYRRRLGSSVGHERALVVGVGSDAAHLARHRSDGPAAISVVGFVDPASQLVDTKRTLAGRPVFGGLSDVPSLIREHDVDQVIIACTNADEYGRRLVDLCIDVDVRLRILPAIDSVLEESSATRDIRDLELEDLLPRGTVSTDLSAVRRLLAGRRILVTGAGGSIGSELVRQILTFDPAQVIALDHDETHLHEAQATWQTSQERLLAVELADIRDARRVDSIFEQYRPHIVFHAAAHKHVPILERFPDEAVKTNVLGTDNVMQAAEACPSFERFVLISTDKAVEPTSMMGASKRLAEMLVQARSGAGDGKWCAVRFGNVLGSRGSVVPTFTKQVQAGGPVTISHPDMERYFMTVGEAVELVLQAASLSAGGEVFVLDMGQPVRIIDLAHRMIRLAGLVPDKDIEIVVTGPRPGERLSERLALQPLLATEHDQILKAVPWMPSAASIDQGLASLTRLVEDSDPTIGEVLIDLANAESRTDTVIYLEPADVVPVERVVHG